MIAHLDVCYLLIVFAVLLPALTTANRNVRIVSSGSSTVSEGILEVNLTGSWQVLCVWGFGDVEARVACRELGYVGGTALPIAAYGPHSGVYTTPFRGCKGDETSLLDCSLDSQGHEDICRGQDIYYASVHCYNEITTQQGPSVNLTNGYHGDVTYFQSGVWGQVCLTYWSDKEASVACRELGYKGGVATRAESADNQPFTLTGIRCHGNESKLLDCKHTLEICYDTPHRAAVVCYNSGLSVHLADKDSKRGRVEIEYDGVDGFLTLCGLGLPGIHHSKTAPLICRQLGFATGSFITNTPAQGAIYWTIEECDGTKDNIFMCRNKGWSPERTSNCSADSNVVSVSCSVGVNIVGGITTDNVTMGMVEMFTNEKWTTVCGHDFDQNEAVVICQQLGFTNAQSLLPDMFGRYRFSIFSTELACIGNETALSDCIHTIGFCRYSSHASVLCTNGQIHTGFKASLSNGNYGTVLIEKYGMVGTVCRHGWDDRDSKVLCGQLGYRGGVALGTKTVTTRYNPIWLSAVNCTGQENRIQECVSKLSIDPACGMDMSSAGGLCFNDTEPSVNLVGGSQSGEGRAEVTYAGVSGTICDNGWSANDAKVLCRQQGFPNGIPRRISFFGQGTGPVYLDNVQCDGTEPNILSCPNFGWNISSHGCGFHNNDAGVSCISWASLAISRYYGPVTVYDDKTSKYGLVCDDGHFGNEAAEILCKERGNQHGIAVRCSTFGDMSNRYAIANVNCNGTETKLADCKYESTNYCPTNEYISVVCAAIWIPSATQIMLQNGDHGYVKVSYFHQYGYICSEGFDDVDATVICKMRGYLYGAAYRHHTQTEKLGNIHKNNFRWLSNLNCSSTANTLDDCDLRWGETCKCDYRTVAGVFCLSQPEAAMIELENGTAMEGRVLVKVNADTKGLVCGDYFSHNEADVVCRQLGYRSGILLDAGSYGNVSAVGVYFLDSMKCDGNETSFLECAIEPHYHFVACRSGAAAVKCYNNVRLTAGSVKPNFGRVELYNGQRWEAVCDENFDDTDARVVCKSLGYVTGRSQCCSSFGVQPVDVEIHLTNMTCDGTEDKPEDCFYDTMGACPSDRYASVLCSTESTLEDVVVQLPENSYYGPVQVRRYGIWGYICATGWDDEDADVTCRTLGYRTGKAVRNLVGDADVIILGNVRCRGVEQHFGDCILDKFGADTGCYNREAIAGVICVNTTDKLSFKIRGTGKSSTLYIHTDNNYLYIDKSEFDDVAASLVCKEINQLYVDGSAFGFTSHLPGVVKFHCTGKEDSVFDCIGDWDPALKEAVTIASVNCHRGVKLVGGQSHYGIVEVYNGDTWGTICANTFSDSDAGVVCRNLGFDNGISLCCSPFGKAMSSVLVSSLQCAGTESYVRQCQATYLHPNKVSGSQNTCSADNYASVVCYNGARQEDYTLSLPKSNFGQVSELVLTYLGVEGRICADGWNDYDAKVACKQQGFKYGVAYTHFVENVTQSNGPYWSSNFTCSGLENDLLECRHVGFGRVQKCNKRHYAGMICFDADGPTYKISGGDRNSKWGRVEIRLPGEGWGTICNTYWGQSEAQALCKQFGYDTGEVYQGEYTMPPPRLVYDVKYMCTGNEDRLKDCPHGGWLESYIDTCNSHHSDAGVTCRMTGVPVTSTKGPEPGPEHRKGNTALVVGVILGCVLVIVLFVIIILVLKWRQNQKGSLGHERFRNDILQQGRDGSLHLHNPLHGESASESGSIAMDTSGSVIYRSDNAVSNTSNPQYVNPTYDTTHNTTNSKKCDVDIKSRDNVSNNDRTHDVEHTDANNQDDPSESAYTKLGLPLDSHIYES